MVKGLARVGNTESSRLAANTNAMAYEVQIGRTHRQLFE